MTTLKDYIATAAELPLLGSLCINTTYDGAYEIDAIKARFEAEGLDTSLIPSPSGAADAFAKAITAQKETNYPLSNGHNISILLRDVTSQNPAEYTIKGIVREERDTRGERLYFEKIGEFKHYRGVRRGTGERKIDDSAAVLRWGMIPDTEALTISDEERTKIRNIAVRVQRDYERFRMALDGKKIRSMTTSYLRRLDAVKLKDSVYFVPVAHAKEMSALCRVISGLGRCRLDTVPIIDFEDQRDLVIRSFQADTEEAMRNLAEQLQAARAKPSPATFVRLRKQYDELTARTEAYTSTLGDVVAEVSGQHDVVKSLLAALSKELLK